MHFSLQIQEKAFSGSIGIKIDNWHMGPHETQKLLHKKGHICLSEETA